jgi:thioredoxin 1
VVKLIKFGASWCVPCKMMEPIINNLKETYADKVEFVAFDADEHSDEFTEYSVTTVPTIVIEHNGGVEKLEGASSPIAEKLKEICES